MLKFRRKLSATGSGQGVPKASSDPQAQTPGSSPIFSPDHKPRYLMQPVILTLIAGQVQGQQLPSYYQTILNQLLTKIDEEKAYQLAKFVASAGLELAPLIKEYEQWHRDNGYDLPGADR